MSNTQFNPVARHEAQVAAELTRIVARLRAVAEQHHVRIADLEKILRQLVRQAERDQDFDLGLFDISARDRAALKKQTQGRARP
jgi:hypothetical protein